MIAEAPTPLNQGAGVWTDDEIVVVGANLDRNNTPVSADSDVANSAVAMAYNPATNQWRLLPEPGLSPQASTVVFTAGRLIAWDYLLDVATYDPNSTADRWDPLPMVPVDTSECSPETVATADQVLALFCGQAAVLDVAASRWRRVELPTPTPAGPMVANGDQILVTAGTGPGAVWAANLATLGTSGPAHGE